MSSATVVIGAFLSGEGHRARDRLAWFYPTKRRVKRRRSLTGNPSDPGYARQPAVYPFGIERDAEGRRFYRVDPPAILEGRSNLFLPDPTRSPIAWLTIAEAQHEVAAAGDKRGVQAVRERAAFIVVEYVEQATVQHGVELLPELGEFQRIPDQKSGRQATVASLLLGSGDGAGRDVDPGRWQTDCGGHEYVFASAAADIEDPAAYRAGLGQR
jgi:hypothetical protein